MFLSLWGVEGDRCTVWSRIRGQQIVTPRVHAVQPAGCATVVGPFQRGENSIQPIESTTRISGLSVPFDIDGTLALDNLRKFGGQGLAVTDDEVFEAQRALFESEGIYAEPAGAAALAGLQGAIRKRTLDPEERLYACDVQWFQQMLFPNGRRHIRRSRRQFQISSLTSTGPSNVRSRLVGSTTSRIRLSRVR